VEIAAPCLYDRLRTLGRGVRLVCGLPPLMAIAGIYLASRDELVKSKGTTSVRHGNRGRRAILFMGVTGALP
jgi:hypothetical protein